MMQPVPMAPSQPGPGTDTAAASLAAGSGGKAAFAARLTDAVRSRDGLPAAGETEQNLSALESALAGGLIMATGPVAITEGQPAPTASGQGMGMSLLPAGPGTGQQEQPVPTSISQLLESITSQPATLQETTPSAEEAGPGGRPQAPTPAQPEPATTFRGRTGDFPATVESWQARYATPTTAPEQQTGNQPQETGQPVIDSSLLEFDDPAAMHQSSGSVPLRDPGLQRQDVNGHFIHSNLPNGASGLVGQTAQDGTAGEQAGTTMDNRGEQPMDPQVQGQGGNNSDTPLIFSLDQGNSSSHSQGITSGSPASAPLTPGQLEVHEDSIVRQVQDHFSLRGNLESGRVVLKLHPEELGELRMEIKVEQDNIKAHITTQNPQVQEILDRHMPRLREALEQQGFNLEQVEVTVAADDGNQSDFFQENRQQDVFRQPAGSSGQPRFTVISPEEDEERQDGHEDRLSLHA